jgi:hypothetical protein
MLSLSEFRYIEMTTTITLRSSTPEATFTLVSQNALTVVAPSGILAAKILLSSRRPSRRFRDFQPFGPAPRLPV